MKKQLLFTAALTVMMIFSSFAQQIPNGGFENWHAQGQGEDPDNWGSLYNQFNLTPKLVTKTTEAKSGTYALKLICDTGTVPPPLGSGNPGDTIYGSVMAGLLNAQVSNARLPFASKPDSLTGYIKGTVLGGGLYMEMKLFKTGAQIANAYYIFVSTAANYTRFAVKITYSQSVTPDTMTFSIIAAHPGLQPPAVPGNQFFVDDLALVYNSTGVNDLADKSTFTIYPNPVQDKLNILQQQSNGETEVMIYNAIGEAVQKASIKRDFPSVTVSDLPAGLYFYQISDRNGNLLDKGKFMKE